MSLPSLEIQNLLFPCQCICQVKIQNPLFPCQFLCQDKKYISHCFLASVFAKFRNTEPAASLPVSLPNITDTEHIVSLPVSLPRLEIQISLFLPSLEAQNLLFPCQCLCNVRNTEPIVSFLFWHMLKDYLTIHAQLSGGNEGTYLLA